MLLCNVLIHSCWEHSSMMVLSSFSGRKQTLKSMIPKLHSQTETHMSKNKQEIHEPDSFIRPLFIEIQISATVVFFAGD